MLHFRSELSSEAAIACFPGLCTKYCVSLLLMALVGPGLNNLELVLGRVRVAEVGEQGAEIR